MSAPLERIARLDGRQRSKAAVLAKLARDLDFPPYFRPNLDALFDVLTTDMRGPLRIEWRLSAAVEAALGADLEPLRQTLAAAAAARDDLVLEVTRG